MNKLLTAPAPTVAARYQPARVRALFDHLADTYGAAEWLSGGQLGRWRRSLVAALCWPAIGPVQVVDLMAGGAELWPPLSQRLGERLTVTAVDFSAAMLARKFELPVIPVNIRARNSVLFYLFDLIHPTLRDITLFHEMLNKAKQPYVVNVGEEISPASLPASSEEGIEMLRQATLALGGREDHTVSMLSATRKPALRF